jgi:hypothetical protein
MTRTKDVINRQLDYALEQGFQDGRKYEAILKEIKSIENVGEGNKEYVKKFLAEHDNEIIGIGAYHGAESIKEYDIERSRLIKQLGNSKELELKEMELDYLAPSNNE